MPRLCLLFASACALVGLPVASGAAPNGSGSLSLSGVSGSVLLQGEGVLFGAMAAGSIEVYSFHPEGGAQGLSVEGASAKTQGGVTSYTGTNLHFLVPAGSYSLELTGSGIDASAIGEGTVSETAATAGGILSQSPAQPSAGAPRVTSWVSRDGEPQLPLSAVPMPASFGSSLVLNGAVGSLSMQASGVVFGSISDGTLLLYTAKAVGPAGAPSIVGGVAHVAPGGTSYAGSGLRFLLPEGSYSFAATGERIDVTVLGSGTFGVTPGAPASSPAASSNTAFLSLPVSLGSPSGSVSIDGASPIPFASLENPASFGAQGS